MIQRNWCVLIIMATLFSSPSAAIEVLSAKELAAHCEVLPEAPDSVDGQYCIRYIQGFVDGAVATDVRVMMNLEAEHERKETYTERAFRTRSPNNMERRHASELAGFCLGDPVQLRDVVARVADDLEGRAEDPEAELSAREVVYASLRKHYRCENTDS